MTIYYHSYTFFGIEYTFEDLKFLKQKFNFLGDKIGNTELPNILCEAYNGSLLTFINTNNYINEETQIYYFGVILTNELLYSNPNYQYFSHLLEQECNTLGITYKVPDIHNVVILS